MLETGERERNPDQAQQQTGWRWWPLLLPASYLLHLAEEWFGGEGLTAWTGQALGRAVSAERFLLLNGLFWPLVAVFTVAAVKWPRLSWVLSTFGALFLVNGVLHALGSLAFASYSPGLVTGLLLYLPVGGYALHAGREQLPPATFARAVLLGLAIHAVVAVVAFG